MDIEVSSSLEIAGRPASVINDNTGFSTDAIVSSPEVRQLAAQLSRWVDNARAVTGRTSMFDRGAYIPPENPYDEMRASRHALKYDSIVSGVAEITEAVAFVGLKWEGEDPDDADVFNQWSRDVNLDQVVRAMWREEFILSQTVVAKIWGWSTYQVRGKTKKGNARKKSYRIWVPQTLRTLNPARCVPVDLGPLGGDRLAWASDTEEIGYYGEVWAGTKVDPLMLAFFDGVYTPPLEDQRQMSKWGVDINNLLLIDPEWVFRHCATKPDYEAFPEPRLKACFQLLDLKTQLLAADRASLIGNANYILLVKKGDKDAPAKQEEMDNLKANYSCLDEEAEIFTKHGWLDCDQLRVGDQALSINPSTGMSEWRPVRNTFISEPGPKQMIRMEGTTHHSLSTPNHRWYVEGQDGPRVRGARIKTTEELLGVDYIPFAAPRADCPGVEVHSDELVELVAWWYTEGSLHRLGQGGSVSQSVHVNPDHTERIHRSLLKLYGEPGPVQRRSTMTAEAVGEARLLREQGFTRKASAARVGISASAIQRWENGEIARPSVALWDMCSPRPNGVVVFALSKAVVDELELQAPEKVPSFEFLLTLTQRQLELFIQVSMWADRSGHTFAQKDSRRVEAFEYACLLAGHGVSRNVPSNGMTRTAMLKSRRFGPVAAARQDARFRICPETYFGRVWCPEVEQNGTWLARSRGKVFFTGNTISRVPVIISDHRLNIEIIAPKTDFTLDGSKYEVLDNRLLNRLLGTLTVGGRGQRNETQVTISEIVAKVMENRRHMMKRTLEAEIARAIVRHPKNEGVFGSEPNLVFTPRNISLGFSQSLIQGLLSLRTQREISRETVLEYFSLDQATEAQRMENERDYFDEVFATIPLPGQQVVGGDPPPEATTTDTGTGAQPGPNGAGEAPAVSGRRGGRPVGGGKTPANPVKQAKPRGPGGNPSTKAAELQGDEDGPDDES